MRVQHTTYPSARLSVRLGKLHDLLIAEIRPEDPAPNASDAYNAVMLPLYSFLLIDQTTPTLVVSSLSIDWLKTYTQANLAELTIAHPKPDDFIITASTEEFQAFLLKHYKDASAISDKTTFVRPTKL